MSLIWQCVVLIHFWRCDIGPFLYPETKFGDSTSKFKLQWFAGTYAPFWTIFVFSISEILGRAYALRALPPGYAPVVILDYFLISETIVFFISIVIVLFKLYFFWSGFFLLHNCLWNIFTPIQLCHNLHARHCWEAHQSTVTWNRSAFMESRNNLTIPFGFQCAQKIASSLPSIPQQQML